MCCVHVCALPGAVPQELPRHVCISNPISSVQPALQCLGSAGRGRGGSVWPSTHLHAELQAPHDTAVLYWHVCVHAICSVAGLSSGGRGWAAGVLGGWLRQLWVCNFTRRAEFWHRVPVL